MTSNLLFSRTARVAATLAIATSISAACSLASPEPVEPGTHQIEVVFSNVQSETGMIWASLCTKEQHAKLGQEPCEMSARVDAKDGASMSFSDVPSGIYAISAYHDSNANEALDFDTRGIPYEPTGNRGNAKGFLGPK